MLDLIKAFNSNLKLKKIGIRPGEKIHEEMVTESDSLNTIELKKYYVILLIHSQKIKFIKHEIFTKKI